MEILVCGECDKIADYLLISESIGKPVCQDCYDLARSGNRPPRIQEEVELHPEDIRNR